MDNTNRIESFRGDYRFLSNFYRAKTVYKGVEYPTTEHAYQAAKSNDERIRRIIAKLRTPKEAKHTGQMIKLRSDWEGVKVCIMTALLKSKFSDINLMDKLVATGNAYLVEGNYWKDTFWGVYNGEGENMLGRILMDIRNAEIDMRKI